MTNQALLSEILQLKTEVRETSPLIHCITNHISINDCANTILAVGARPIMAEHPLESAEITKGAKALGVNIGNISDARMIAIANSGESAEISKIPHVIDAVGVACSDLRLKFALGYIREFKPKIIKGNISEIKALCGDKTDASGVDAGKKDSGMDIKKMAERALAFANATGAVVYITGKTDIIANCERAYYVQNGTARLGQITGTGCMANGLCATFLSVGSPLYAAILSAVVMGISGELAQNARGIYSFKTALMDEISELDNKTISEQIKIIL